MVEAVVIEDKPLLGDKQAGARASLQAAQGGGWRLSAAWLPVAAIAGALAMLAVISSVASSQNGWWLEFGGHHGSPRALLPRPDAAALQATHAALLAGSRPDRQQAALAGSLEGEEEVRQYWAARLRVPWGPQLTAEEAARGLTYYGSGGRLQAVARKLLDGKPIKVFTLGASVSRGIGASRPAFSYPRRFFHFLNATFPHRDHVFRNRGIGGTSSSIYSVCAEHMVDADADIVVLEFTINDARDAPYTYAERRGYEQLVRKVLAMPGRPAVLQLHHWGWWHAVGDGVEQGGLFYYPPGEAQLGVFAHYYDFPSLSVRAAMWRLMQARLPGFNPDRQRFGSDGSAPGGLSPTNVFIPAAEKGRERDYWYRDRTHPGDEGHAMLSELLASAVSRAVFETLSPRPSPQLVAQDGSRAGASLGADGLPPPMVPGNMAAPTSLCAIEEAFKDVVVASSGFEYRAERPDAPSFVEQKWGWTGLEPGSWAEMEFDTATGFQNLHVSNDSSAKVGGADSPSPNAEVSLSYLRSYERMGAADVTCVSGCTCRPVVLDATWEKRVSLQQILQFWVTRHPRCRVRVTIADRIGSIPQDGHKVTLTAVMVSHWALRLNKYMEQVEVVAGTMH